MEAYLIFCLMLILFVSSSFAAAIAEPGLGGTVGGLLDTVGGYAVKED